MGTFKRGLNWLFGKSAATRLSDSLLDWQIADALMEDARSPVPAGAWERLRKAITDRKLVRGYGMWVLDETFRDPPESPPATLSDAQLARAMHIYRRRQTQRRWTIGQSPLGNWSPTFIVVVNL